MGYHSKRMDEFLGKKSDLPLLTRFQVARLIKQMREGNEWESERAKRKLVEHNLFLVVSICAKFKRTRRMKGMSFDDLLQEGFIGLMTAIEKFEPERGHAFSTYATWWIRQRVQRSYDDQDNIIRRPVHTREAIGRFKRIQDEMSRAAMEQGGEAQEPTLEEVYRELKKQYPQTYNGVLDLIKAGFDREVLSLESEIRATRGSGDPTLIGDFLADDSPEADVAGDESPIGVEDLISCLDVLDERERRIIELRFGIEGEFGTLQSVGEDEKLSRERVRQIQVAALNKLRDEFRRRGYKRTKYGVELEEGKMPQYITVQDVAIELSTSSQTVYRMIESYPVNKHRSRDGRRIFVDERELPRLREARRQEMLGLKAKTIKRKVYESEDEEAAS